jgi:hypothetical protein
MKKTNFALSAAVAMAMGSAPSVWAGNGGPYGPVIDTYGYAACEVYKYVDDEWANPPNGALTHIKGGDTQVLHTVEAGSGNVNAVCNGKNPYLVKYYESKPALQYGPDDWGNPKCTIIYEDDWGNYQHVYTSDWKQTLTNKGNYSLNCHFKPEDVD